MENKEKLFHFHLEDGCNNAKTLVCRLVNGSIKYSFYGVNGNMRWKRNASLPVDTLHNETKEEFKQRVKAMLNNSTVSVVGEVSTNVTFA